MKHQISGFVYAEPIRYGEKRGGMEVGFTMHKPTAELWPERVVVSKHSIEVEVPDNFDPRPGMVANLEQKKREVQAEYAAKVKEINDRIQSLLALENHA